MSKPTVYVEFEMGKSPVIRAEGFKGESCHDATRGIEKALGYVEKTKPTEELYERDNTQQIHNHN